MELNRWRADKRKVRVVAGDKAINTTTGIGRQQQGKKKVGSGIEDFIQCNRMLAEGAVVVRFAKNPVRMPYFQN